MTWKAYNHERVAELGHDMSEGRVTPELPGKNLATVAQTDGTVTLQDMNDSERYLTSDYVVMLDGQSNE